MPKQLSALLLGFGALIGVVEAETGPAIGVATQSATGLAAAADDRREPEGDSECRTPCTDVGEWQFGIAAGYGYAPNPLVDGDDVVLPLLPRISYYGDHFFLETGTFGFTVFESEQQRLNLQAQPNLDYFFFAESGSFYQVLTHPFRYGLPGELCPRKLTYLASVDYSWFHDNWQLKARIGQDISVGHDGIEAAVAASHHWQHGDSSLQTSVGALYRDDRLSRYYYGVTAEETEWLEKRYQPEASWSPYLSLTAEHRLSEQLSLLGLLAAQRPASEIYASPLVQDRWFLASFVGVAYVF